MHERFPLMIVDSPSEAGTATVTAPYDGTGIADVDTGDERHVDKALDTAYALFRNRDSWLPVHECIRILAGPLERFAVRAAKPARKRLGTTIPIQ